jgi:hypothetical protein
MSGYSPQQPPGGYPPPSAGWGPPPPPKNNTGKIVTFSCLGILALFLLIGVIGLVIDGGSDTTASKPKTDPSAASSGIPKECRKWIEKELLDSSDDIDADSGYAVCGDLSDDEMARAIDEVTKGLTGDAKAKDDKSAPEGPATSFGPGVYLVGEDIKPGTYKTPGPDEDSFSGGCSWSRNKDDSGEFDAIISNDFVQGPTRVTVKKGEVFETNGCQDWTVAK